MVWHLWTPPFLLLLLLLGALAQDGGPYCIRVREDACTSTPRESCEDVTRTQCQMSEKQRCVHSTEEWCSSAPSAEDECSLVEREVCRDITKEVCTPKVETRCVDVKKWICPPHHGHFICKCLFDHRRHLNFCAEECERKWNQAYCWTEVEKECTTHNTTSCKNETKQICAQVPEEKCHSQKETVCETIPTEKCEPEMVEKCENVTENVCTTVEDHKCEKQFVDRFCTQDEEGLLRSSIFNGDVLGASSLLSSSENLFSLGEGLMYLPEQTFLVIKTENRSRDPDVVAFQALATSALNNTDVTKLVNAIMLSVIPDCRCRDRTAAEYDVIARGLKEDFSDRSYLEQLVDSDLSEFDGLGRRKLMATDISPVESFVCSFCAPKRSCSKFWWC